MERIQIDDFSQVKMLSQLQASPSGEKLAFVVTQAQVKANKYVSHIHLLENGKVRKLTSGGAEKSLYWLDEEHILFPGDRTGKYKAMADEGFHYTVFNKISTQGGEAEEYFALPFPASNLIVLGDGKFLCIGQYDNYAMTTEGLEGAEKEEMLQKIQEEKDYEIFDELPFWFNGKGIVNKKRGRVYLCDICKDEQKAITGPYMQVTGLKYNKELGLALYYGSDYQWMDDQISRMFVYDLKTGESREMDLGGKYRVQAADFVGDHILMAATTGERYGSNENPIFFNVDVNTGKMQELADLDTSLGSSVGSDCRYGGGATNKGEKGGFYFLETMGFNSFIRKLDEKGQVKTVSPDVHGSVDCFQKVGDTFYYVGMRCNGLQEIYCCKEGGEENCLTCFNKEFLESRSVVEPKYMHFTDKDGVDIDGWILEPVDYDPSKKYPAILNVHGGPKAVYGETFFHEMQFWANEGYFVFYCNPRGGDGKGNDFANIRGEHYGVWDYNDLMEFTDKVLEKYPQIDQKRVGMAGGSYGGFMANWIVGHTDRFAAVASQRSISNYLSKCLTTDIGYYHNLSAMMADPWTNMDRMWNNSPLKYADKAKTPTLFIQSDEDYRCWMADALQMMTALRMHGVETRLCLFHGENHELSRSGKPKHRIRRLREITNWFDHYMK